VGLRALGARPIKIMTGFLLQTFNGETGRRRSSASGLFAFNGSAAVSNGVVFNGRGEGVLNGLDAERRKMARARHQQGSLRMSDGKEAQKKEGKVESVILRITNPYPVAHDAIVSVCRGQKLSLGRGEECDVVVLNQFVSRKHLVLTWEGSSLMLKDLRSLNGVRLNGKHIRDDVRLKVGDVLELSNVKIAILPGLDATQSLSSQTIDAIKKPQWKPNALFAQSDGCAQQVVQEQGSDIPFVDHSYDGHNDAHPKFEMHEPSRESGTQTDIESYSAVRAKRIAAVGVVAAFLIGIFIVLF
jgi:pSer/pThr/pTyr-binding forkhead associated (FHA) protein